ncbi:MAG: glycosyltransferase, partial [Nanoarchaeota archaeon]|nr:glycosyltransferase [Nanoarchaeota archaeon]
EKSYKHADSITVSSSMLKSIYGGNVIYQVANEFAFRKKQKNDFRKKHKLEDKIIIAHAGTFFEHKGMDILIKAVQKINNNKIRLVLAGNSNIEKYKRIAGDETLFTGKIPMNEAAQLTDAADIYVIPTKDTPYARAEIPAKIFEPMMMGKPIIASRISDIPKIVDNGRCGKLVKPGSVKQLADTIQYLIDNPEERKKLGNNAKKRYDSNYSYNQMEKKISDIYKIIEENVG